MVWTAGNYPVEMQGLEPSVRAQAIQIANRLLQEGYEEDAAVTVAISRAKMSSSQETAEATDQDLHVVMHNDGWAVKREQSEESDFVFADFETREKALSKALELGRYERVGVVVHAEDGQVIEYVDLRNPST